MAKLDCVTTFTVVDSGFYLWILFRVLVCQ